MDWYEQQRKESEERILRRKAEVAKMKKRIIGGVIAGVVLFGTVIGIATCSETIKPGYVGIVYNLKGGIEGKVLTQGWNVITPMQKVQQYSVATEQAYLSRDKKEGSKEDDSFNIPTSDGKTVNVDLEFSYHFDAQKLPDTFTKFKGQDGKTIEDTFIRGKIKAWASEVSSTFSVLDVYGEKRAALNGQVLKHVQEKFAEYGIVIDSVNFSRIELDQQTAEAIQKRINSQQALEQAKIDKEKDLIDAEKRVEIAKKDAEAKVVAAQGEARANQELQQSITPLLIQKMEMEARLKHGWVTIQGGQPVVQTPAPAK